jgi:hypothetical protein
MTDYSLYQRLRKFGTLTETPADIPDAVFALPATIHWMRALALLVEDEAVNFQSSRIFYGKVQKREMDDRTLNTVSEQLLFAFHQIAALRALSVVHSKADVARMAIVTWYYGIYGAASAMVAAADGSFQDNHTATAQQWDVRFPSRGLAMAPFGDRLTSVLKNDVKEGLEAVRVRGKHSLTTMPKTVEQAWGCVAEYLSGTAKWEQWNCEERVKDNPAFKALDVDSFRTAAAKALRDDAYRKRSIAFLQQASRYRGKANYRDAIFLAYGKTVATRLENLVADLPPVLEGFAAMAAGYCSLRIGKENWQIFLKDLEENRSLSISPAALWS